MKHQTEGNRIFYLAIPPTLYEHVISNLGAAGLSQEERGYTHVSIEKPFGRDLDSARRLNRIVKNCFDEKQVYRIDHFLALETVQISSSPIRKTPFSSPYGIGDISTISRSRPPRHWALKQRAGYYEEAVSSEICSKITCSSSSLTAMGASGQLWGGTRARRKVRFLAPLNRFPMDRLSEYVAIGQYGRGKINQTRFPGIGRKGVSEKSVTATFAAIEGAD